jgi:mRNA-degrading endonuclease RelE of RelBE toxin-antitoxin system
MLFIEFDAFTKAIVKLPDDDYAKFQRELIANPEQGDLVRGTGGFRKARMAFPSAGIGKSGGARVIYLYIADLHIVVLVSVYAKTKKSDLSRAEENELRAISREIRRSLGSHEPGTV